MTTISKVDLNHNQFEALASLMRMKEGPSKDVAWHVIVNGISFKDAVMYAKADPKAARQCLKRIEEAMQKIRLVASDGRFGA